MKIVDIIIERNDNTITVIDPNIKSLAEYEPLQKETYGSLKISSNCVSLETLEGCPSTIENISIYGTKIKNLVGLPKRCISLSLFGCENFRRFDGGPEYVENLHCEHLIISSLDNCPKQIDNQFSDQHNHLVLRNVWTHIHECGEYYHTGDLDPDSGLLGLLRIKKLIEVIFEDQDEQLETIINKYLPLKTMSDIIRCKHELIEAGFKSNARF